jgi:cytochrome c-type biogenesis protein CcsB
MALTGYFTQIYPNPSDTIDTWHNPQQALFRFKDKYSTVAVLQYMKYLVHLKRAKENVNYDTCNIIVDEIIASQKSVAGDVMPTDTQVNLEIGYNKYNVFYNLTKLQMILGFTLLILLFIQIFLSNSSKGVKIINVLSKGIILAIIIGFIAHGLGLGARWYISGHAPWSNGYEALMFISFITILAGLIFARRSKIALAAAVILASLMLFVGHMNTMNPEITNLVPVLKSYWLMIHVAIITSSYGFLGLGCILGLVNLFIDLFRKKTSSPKIKDTYKELTYITEMTITIGLFALSIGTFLGGVWANESWGRYWGWDAKETWAFISMLVYSIILHFRYIPGLKGRSTFNFASTIGYVSIIFTFYGVNYLLGGLHSYAKGDPVPIPSWIYYTIGVVILLGIVAMIKERKRKKKT